jgi:hypothetical protein
MFNKDHGRRHEHTSAKANPNARVTTLEVRHHAPFGKVSLLGCLTPWPPTCTYTSFVSVKVQGWCFTHMWQVQYTWYCYWCYPEIKLVLPQVCTRQVLVVGWYYLTSLPGRYRFKVGIASGHTNLVIPATLPLYIPVLQSSICPTLVMTR